MNNRRLYSLNGIFAIALLSASLACAPAAFANHGGITGNRMVLVGTEGVKNSDYGKFLTLVFTEALGRLGYTLQYDGYPAARASALSDSGAADGEISRVFDYQSAHPNLIRIEEPLYATSFVAFAARPGIRVNGWESLKGQGYRVNYRRGVKLSKSKLAQVVDPSLLAEVSAVEQGIKKLLIGRSDLYVDVEFTILKVVKQLNPDAFDVSVLYPAGTLQEVRAFAYLHKKHANLVPRLTQILQTMKVQGLFRQYLETAMEKP